LEATALLVVSGRLPLFGEALNFTNIRADRENFFSCGPLVAQSFAAVAGWTLAPSLALNPRTQRVSLLLLSRL